ncbi:uncharacterized protein [Penaeus vannamei]|uniref:uncharacterized protein isoform X8 n=1 Tax=Penaeus vannamei TaxID=6689 RepID=UPI00387F3AA4
MGEPLEAVEGSDSEISRLFPKCRPRSATHTPTTTTPTTTPSDARRSDLNLNCVLDSDDNDNYETETITTAGDLPTIYDNSKLSRDSGSSGRMSVDSGSGSRSGSTPGSRSGSHSGSHSESTKMERSAEDVDMDMDVSVVSGYDEYDERYMRSSVLDSSYEEPPPPPPTSRPQAPRREHFRLRDSRIEIAGGREVFSHSRSRPARRRHDESQRRGSQQVQHQQYPHDRQQQEQQWPESPGDSEGRGRGSSVRESPLVYETRLTGSSEVVFDDIGEWVARGLTVRALDDRPGSPSSPTADHQVNPAEHGDHGYLAAYERSTSPSDSDSTQGSPHKVTKIGNVPIAEYEGSPRRYGPRPSPRTHSPRGPHSHHGPPPRPPRPGFPRRVLAEEAAAREAHEAREALPPAEVSIPPRAVEETGQVATQEDGGGGECPPDSSCSEGGSMSPAPPVIAISTLTSSYSTNLAPQQDASRVDSDMYDYSYEMSETRKVLEEFFKEQGGSRGDEFLDLEYHLKRQQGNSYVGLRLAAEYAEDQAEGAPEECPSDQKDGGSEQHSNAPDHRSDIPEHHSSNAEHHSSVSEHHQEASEHQHASGTEQQRREQQCNSGSSAAHGLEPDLDATTYEVGHSRNFTLSPETTSCDSGDVESDYSGVDPEGSIHSSSRGICSAMPVLEDGLSSGDESGMDEREETKEVLYEKEKQDEAIIEQEQHHHQRPIVRSLDEQLCRGELPPLNPLPTLNSHNSPLPNAASSPHSKVHSRNSPHTNTQSPSSSTLTLMKKQITEIEREIALRKPEGGPRRGGLEGDGPHPPLDLHLLDPLNEKVIEPPPPPAPHPHRGGSTGNSSVVENGSSSSTPIQMPTTAVSPSRVLGHLHSPQYTPVSGPSTGPHLLSAMGSLTSPVQHQVTPHMVPGHPAAHDILHNPGGGVGQSRESVEAAIADIKQAIRRTKNMTLKSHPQERSPINDKGPVWIPRNNRREPQQQQQQQQPQQQQPPPQPQTPQQQQQPPSCQQSQQQSPQSQQHSQLDVAEASRTPEHVRHEDGEWRRLHIRQEDGDTDQETDRLLGQQRSDDPGFYDEKGWRRPKTRTVMPRAANHKANGGGATSNGSTPSTPIGQGHQVSANQTPSTPPDMAASNKNKNKKVIGGCLLSLKHLCNDRKCTLHAPCSKFVDV